MQFGAIMSFVAGVEDIIDPTCFGSIMSFVRCVEDIIAPKLLTFVEPSYTRYVFEGDISN